LATDGPSLARVDTVVYAAFGRTWTRAGPGRPDAHATESERIMAASRTLIDHEEVLSWAQARGAKPGGTWSAEGTDDEEENEEEDAEDEDDEDEEGAEDEDEIEDEDEDEEDDFDDDEEDDEDIGDVEADDEGRR
jgi:hypothetical protein